MCRIVKLILTLISVKLILTLIPLILQGEVSDFFICIYPYELQLKCEHHGLHATFFHLDIIVDDAICEYKHYDKRDNYPFVIDRMPDLSGNIPAYVLFYVSVLPEFLRIT